jgi:hypothetical protein
MSVIEALKETHAKQREDADRAFAKLVREIVSGDAVRPDAAQRVLDASGKTPEDLDRAIAEARQRADLLARVQRGRDAAKEKTELQGQLFALSSEFEKAEAAHRQKAGPIAYQLRELEAVEQDAAKARDAILSAALPDTPAGRELAAARETLRKRSLERPGILDRVELADVEDSLANRAIQRGELGADERKTAAAKRLTAARQARSDNEQAMAAAKDRVAELERELCGEDEDLRSDD